MFRLLALLLPAVKVSGGRCEAGGRRSKLLCGHFFRQSLSLVEAVEAVADGLLLASTGLSQSTVAAVFPTLSSGSSGFAERTEGGLMETAACFFSVLRLSTCSLPALTSMIEGECLLVV